MSQAKARSFQSLNYLCYNKVCIGTNTTRSYNCSHTSFKALSFVKQFSNEMCENPNQFPGTGKNSSGFEKSSRSLHPNQFYRLDTSKGFQRNLDHSSTRLYSGNASSNDQKSSGANYQTPTGIVNSQVPSYSQPTDKSDKAGEKKPLLGMIEELDAFCKEGKLKKAVKVLGLLKQHNVSVDIPRYLFLIKECGESQALEEAQYVHHHLTSSVPCLDVYIHNKILDMYLKCGSIENAYDVFDQMPKRNLTSWDTMITWLAKNGHGEDAIEMFTEFKRVGLKPDNQIFHGVFGACSVVGDMKEGLLHFESMIKNYNLLPSMNDYVSVVDMLGSTGYLNEALEFIEKMPIKPSVEIWEIMMNQSRVHGDLELGDHCAEIVNILDPSCLDEQSKEGLVPIKPLDIAKEKKKPPGYNRINNRTEVYEYTARDTSHPDHYKLYSQLRCLQQPMKEVGYVPDTRFLLHDVDQESKEEALLINSERLALSKALLTTPARAPIKIIRNFRLCIDSHTALKVISKLVGRVIISRDQKRFHHFENGVCSCGDNW